MPICSGRRTTRSATARARPSARRPDRRRAGPGPHRRPTPTALASDGGRARPPPRPSGPMTADRARRSCNAPPAGSTPRARPSRRSPPRPPSTPASPARHASTKTTARSTSPATSSSSRTAPTTRDTVDPARGAGLVAQRRLRPGRPPARRDTLPEAARGLGWESDIPFDLPVAPSRLSATPGFLDDPLALADTASARASCRPRRCRWRWSPPAIANDGEFMRPYLVAEMTTRTARPSGDAGLASGARDRFRGRRSGRRDDGLRRRGGRAQDGLRPGYASAARPAPPKPATASRTPGSSASSATRARPRYAVAVVARGGRRRRSVALPIGRDLLVAAMAG